MSGVMTKFNLDQILTIGRTKQDMFFFERKKDINISNQWKPDEILYFKEKISQ